MDGGSAVGRVSFDGRPVGAAFECREIHISPGSRRVFAEAEWRDTILVVEQGEVELETIGGERVGFATGAVVFFGTWLRALRNRGRVPVVLSAISRRER